MEISPSRFSLIQAGKRTKIADWIERKIVYIQIGCQSDLLIPKMPQIRLPSTAAKSIQKHQKLKPISLYYLTFLTNLPVDILEFRQSILVVVTIVLVCKVLKKG